MPEPPRPPTAERGGGLSPLFWVVGLIIVVIVILLVFTR
jgi:hypothetical protein